VTRGGVLLGAMGMALVDRNGRPAARWRCALRALFFWLAALGLGSAWLAALTGSLPQNMLNAFGVIAFRSLLFCLPILFLVLALWSPVQAPHDRLAGTYLVPR